jgi:hypothetical protein
VLNAALTKHETTTLAYGARRALVVISIIIMGQSASQPGRPEDLKGKDLYELKENELQILLDDRPLTAAEIQAVARSFLKETASISDSASTSNRKSITTRGSFGFYSQEGDSRETQLAVRVHSISTDLANLRFQMVPKKLKEPVFWEATFTLLNERLVEHNVKYQLNGMENMETAQENGHAQHPNPTIKTKNTKKSSSAQSFPDDEVENGGTLQDQLAAKDFRIAALQRQVGELIDELERVEESVGSTHKGPWIMDKDSKDFLQYPEEVKDNMRREKQKRMRQVLQDMKFILDSDDDKDSNGHWTCCGETEYPAECTKR